MTKTINVQFTYIRSLSVPYEKMSKRQLFILLQSFVGKEIVGVTKDKND